MSTVLLALFGCSVLMGVISLFRPRFSLFFADSARRPPYNGVRLWLLLSLLFWGSFRLLHDADIYPLELAAIFVLAVFTSRFCRRSLLLPALRKSKALYAHGVVGVVFGSVLHPFVAGKMEHIVQEYTWKFIVVLIPALLLALLYDVLTGKFFGFLSRLFGVPLCESLKNTTFDSISLLLGALVNSVFILAGMLVSILLFSVLSDRHFDPYQALPLLLVLYCCLMMSDIITRIIGGELSRSASDRTGP